MTGTMTESKYLVLMASFNQRVLVSLLFMSLFVGCLESRQTNDQPTKVEESKLMHKYGEIVQMPQGETLMFPDFSLTYLKQVDPEDGQEIKTTASILHRYFLIKDMAGAEEEIKITHGQLPPGPYELSLPAGNFTINTYKASDGTIIFDDRIEVLKN